MLFYSSYIVSHHQATVQKPLCPLHTLPEMKKKKKKLKDKYIDIERNFKMTN